MPETWLQRLRAGVSPTPLPPVRAHELGVAPEVIARLEQRFAPSRMRPAAVLLAVFADGGVPRLLLTERAADLPQHAGQICFPGGRGEPQDRDAVATALRETQEEVGLDPRLVQVLGFLPEYPTFTGYRITPVVAWVGEAVILQPDPREVSSFLEIPLEHALDAQHYRLHMVEREGLTLPTWELRYGEYHVWGATAAMLHELCRRTAQAGVALAAHNA
ncbi:MAG: CoA pyrophosphatase [Nevskiales bacterium]